MTNMEKHELGNILHQFYGAHKNTNNSRASSPSTPNGAPFRNCNITANVTTIPHASDPILCDSRIMVLKIFCRDFRARGVLFVIGKSWSCSLFVYVVKSM